jgi:hypothetical protein
MKDSLKAKVYNVFRLDERGIAKVSGPKMGIEIEMEGRVTIPDDSKNYQKWRTERDGSLRGDGAREYISRGAWSMVEGGKNIFYLYEEIKSHRGTILDSMRAGVHVHLNMQNKTILELMTFLALYYTLEDVITEKYCGTDRLGNLFCLRLKDAPYPADVINAAVRSGRYAQSIPNNDEIRYAALNISSLGKYGTVEFRALQTPQNPKGITDWMKMIQKLYNGAAKFGSPEEVLNFFSADGTDNSLKVLDMNELKTVPNYSDKIQKSIWLTQFWVYNNDWK